MPTLAPMVVVFSKGKPEMTYTSEWFARYGYRSAVYVVSDGDDVTSYRQTTGCNVVVAKGAASLPAKRQWAVDNFTSSLRPWLFFFEDNIKRVTGVVPEHYHREVIKPTSRTLYHSRDLSPQEVISYMLEDIQLASSLGACFGGYACNDNHFFRSRKYRTVGFVWTKMAYVHRDGPSWPCEYADEKDDYVYTALCLAQCGRVLINNFLYPWAERYEGRGGSRTIEERAEDRRRTVAELHSRFPGMFRDKHKPGSPEGTEVQLRFINEAQVQRWQSQHQPK